MADDFSAFFVCLGLRTRSPLWTLYTPVFLTGPPLLNSPITLTAFLAIFRAWTVLVPSLLVGGLLLFSFFLKPGGRPGMDFLRGRPLSWWVMTWFIAVSLVLTLVGTFFRGPGWSWVWPWRAHVS